MHPLKVQFRKNPYKPFEWFVIGNNENPVGFCKKKKTHKKPTGIIFPKREKFFPIGIKFR